MSSLLRLLPLLALVGLLAGCDHGGSGSSSSSESQLVQVLGTHTSFGFELDSGWAITSVYEGVPCGSVSYVIDDVTGGDGELGVQAVPTSCPEASQNTQIGNGRHGIYRTIDDVPKPLDEEQISTPLGKAVLFSQAYYECTNRCDNWNEPVVIITLDKPVDPGYPTLVVRGDRDTVSRSRLTSILQQAQVP